MSKEKYTSVKPANNIWTKEECQSEALKYVHRVDFLRYSYGAYQAAHRNKWFEEISSHMIHIGNEYNRLIYRIIFPNNVCYVGLTSNFERRMSEHFTKKGTVYSYIEKTNLTPINIEKMTDYIPIDDAKKQEEYWKCKSETDGYICLNIAKTGGVGSINLKWTKEECQKEASKYSTRTEFLTKQHSAYNSTLKYGWMDDICSHMTLLHNSYTKSECQSEALKYTHRGEFAKNNHKIYCFSKKYNWLDEICSHMILLHNSYTKSECKEEALKYNSRKEFKLCNHSVWQFTQRHKWLDEICSHMTLLRHIWTKEECENEAQNYKNITEFATKNHNIYEFSRKRKWIDKDFYKNN